MLHDYVVSTDLVLYSLVCIWIRFAGSFLDLRKCGVKGRLQIISAA